MKKMLCTAAAVVMLLAFCAHAEFGSPANTVFDLGTAVTADFDSDDLPETMRFVCDLNEYDDGSFTLSVGEQSVTVNDCVSLIRGVKAMKLGYGEFYWGTLFMVSEYGLSDDPLTYCILYTSDGLHSVGEIPGLAEYFSVSQDGVITATVRASMIGTWERPADYILARGWEPVEGGDDWNEYYRLAEVPRTVYPMGMIVRLLTDLPVYPSPYGGDASVQLKAGDLVILAASDDVSRLYVTDYSGREGGWVRMKHQEEPWADLILVNGKYLDADEVFGAIFYAD